MNETERQKISPMKLLRMMLVLSLTVAVAGCAWAASSVPSNIASVTTPALPDTTAPAVPTGFTATVVGANQINLSWNAATDAGGSGLAGYKIYRGGALLATVTGTSYSNTGLGTNTTYCYTVAAYDNANNVSAETAALCRTTTGTPPAAAPEEFVGPFASWTNLKTVYGAVGNGVADDTVALQTALTQLGTGGRSPVLWIPAGTYKITQKLVLTTRENVSIIGEHPDTTILKWAGPSGGTMLWMNGVAYSRCNRLTFDGNGLAQVLVDQYRTGSYFDTANEYADNVFKDTLGGASNQNGIGLRVGGGPGTGAQNGSAEGAVLRCRFYRLGAGVQTMQYNALDWWVWDSLFENCCKGLSNGEAGGLRAYRCIFRGSTVSDIYLDNTDLFSFRDCYSTNSASFLRTTWKYANGSRLVLARNTIVDCTSTNVSPIAVLNPGPLVAYDNIVVTKSGSTLPGLTHYSQDGPDLLSVGNTFTVNPPIRHQGDTGAGRLITVDDEVVPRSSLQIVPPTLPGVLPNYNRTVFAVAPGASQATIQAAINAAAASSSTRPVVHLPAGTYSINSGLVIPPNKEIQIIGDGGATRLTHDNTTNAVIICQGPSRAILRDFNILGGANGDTGPRIAGAGVLVQNADQAGARVTIDQAYLSLNLIANVYADQVDHTLVEIRNSIMTGTSLAPATQGVSTLVVGGPLAAAGNPQQGKTVILSSQTSDNYITFDVRNGGHLIAQDTWYEGRAPILNLARVTGLGFATLENCKLAVDPLTRPLINVTNLMGRVTILGCNTHEMTRISGVGTGKVWFVSNERANATGGPSSGGQILANVSTGVRVEQQNNRWLDLSYGSRSISNQGSLDAAFIREMLAPVRGVQPSNLASRPAGVTDVRVHRVYVHWAQVGIRVQR